jgi:hypothetical protein
MRPNTRQKLWRARLRLIAGMTDRFASQTYAALSCLRVGAAFNYQVYFVGCTSLLKGDLKRNC